MHARCKNGTDAGLPVRLTGVARSHAGHVVTVSDRYRLRVLFRQRGLHPGDGRQRPRHSAAALRVPMRGLPFLGGVFGENLGRTADADGRVVKVIR